MTDDWSFVRVLENDILTFSSEKNSYIREDLAQIWPQFREKLDKIKKDNKGRAIVDIRRIFGGDRIRERSTLKVMVLLMREKGKPPLKKVNAKEALQFMLKNDFCNPHQLIRNKRKLEERKDFFFELFNRVPVYILNTIETPKESLDRLKSLIS
ncbi:hypothetical protein HYT84_03230 [Candidatus Micrarchaeota archaeon]|nr:hypothetical protein [Candidatus Micrarchaeota archaeon]